VVRVSSVAINLIKVYGFAVSRGKDAVRNRRGLCEGVSRVAHIPARPAGMYAPPAYSGRPWGAAEFVQALEHQTQRRLTPGKGGRPRKSRVPESRKTAKVAT